VAASILEAAVAIPILVRLIPAYRSFVVSSAIVIGSDATIVDKDVIINAVSITRTHINLF
jgi:hypothetical protein